MRLHRHIIHGLGVLLLSCYLVPSLASSSMFKLQDTQARPDSLSELYYRNTLFYAYQGDYFTAITHLLSARHSGAMIHEQTDFDLFLADLHLAYGLPDKVFAVFNKTPQISRLEVIERESIWLALAQKAWQSEDSEGMGAMLQRIQRPLTLTNNETIYQRLQMQWMSSEGRQSEMLEILANQQGGMPYHAEFNAAIFLLKNNARQRAIKKLKRLAALKGGHRDKGLSALKDQANLLLAELFYADNRFDEASKFSLKIWSDSMFYNQAQLKLGWAVFERGEYTKAIAEWTRANKAQMDSSMQSMLLAIPYAYLISDKPIAAEQAYMQAISELSSLMDTARRLRDIIESNKAIKVLVEAADNDEFNDLLEGFLHRSSTLKAMRAYRELNALEENITTWESELKSATDIWLSTVENSRKASFSQRISTQQQRIIEVSARLALSKTHWEAWFKHALLNELVDVEKNIREHMGTAKYGLAVLHDQRFLNSPEGVAQ